jgi:predicted DNA repair protein MutK
VSIGLLALLDDVAALAKVAAASLDDIAGQAMKAGAKAAGAVIDDTAVSPKYVHGFAADRELPIVGKIAWGSIKNKVIILLPAALILSWIAPWIITPLLMIGGAYLCYEGAEKVYGLVAPHHAHGHEKSLTPVALDPQSLEDEKVAGAIKTDFILSAEIMVLALSTIETGNFLTEAVVLVLVAFGITGGVYGVVALIVKADDFGVYLASNERPTGGATPAFGRGVVKFMPGFMRVLGIIGTAAMIWVGGGIMTHGLAAFGVSGPEHFVEGLAEGMAHAAPAVGGLLHFLVVAAIDGGIGLVLGLLLIPVAGHVISPAWAAIKNLLPKRGKAKV